MSLLAEAVAGARVRCFYQAFEAGPRQHAVAWRAKCHTSDRGGADAHHWSRPQRIWLSTVSLCGWYLAVY